MLGVLFARASIRRNVYILLSQAMKKNRKKNEDYVDYALKDMTSRKYISRFPVMFRCLRNVYEITSLPFLGNGIICNLMNPL